MMRESPRERSRLGGSGKGAGGLADKKGQWAVLQKHSRSDGRPLSRMKRSQ